MKFSKIILTLLISAFSVQLSAQIASNPYVNGATVNPAPLPSPGTGTSNNVSVTFNFGNSTSTSIPLSTLNGVNISLSKLAVNGAFSTANNIVISGGDYFTFTYDAALNTIVATQKAVIPGNSYETITITHLIVTGTSDISNPQNGLNVNVAFLAAVNPNQVDDHTDAFTYTSAGGPLPIRLVSFNGIKENSSVLLKWQTSSEQDSKLFDVEFSTDGNQWTSIGKVAAAGNSTTTRNYSMVHTTPVNGVNYYRLKQVDTRNNFAYSNIVPIAFTIRGVTIHSVYPNPFVSQLKLDVSSDRTGYVRIQLSDNLGRILRTQSVALQVGVNRISLDNLSDLGSGIYNVEVKTAYSSSRFKLKK